MNEISPGNRLIRRLEPDDRQAVLVGSTPGDYPQGHVFFEPGDSIEHLHFVEVGIVSAVAVMADGRTVETAMVGREGVTGVIAALAPSEALTRNVAQIAVSARRIEASRLRALAAERPAVREVLAGYMASLQGELERSAACNALHRAEQRFAKWLLRCRDRVEGDALSLTQEYLATMLGSQRTTVNEVAQGLQKSGAISYSRGRVTVRDRAALERVACECYRAADTFRLGTDGDE